MEVFNKLMYNNDEGLKINQLVPIVNEEGTSSLVFIFERDSNLIKNDIFEKNEQLDQLYLTIEHIQLLNQVGIIELNGTKYTIKKICPIIDSEKPSLECFIEVTKGIKD